MSRRPWPWLVFVLVLAFLTQTSAPVRPASEYRAARSPSPQAIAHCPPLDLPGGAVATATSEAELREYAYSAAAGTTIVVPAGVYSMQSYVHVIHGGISIRGETGNREQVILDFGGMVGGHFGVLVDADDVTIADLAIRNAADHGVSIQGKDRPKLYNLHIQDIGDQLVKVNPAGDGSDGGLLACSRLEYTTSAPDSYTNGISAHDAHDWVIRDNEWYRIRTIDDTPVPTILFWSGSTDTIVERNLLVDCYQGISFGNASHGAGDHVGGVVRNNVIFVGSGSSNDVAIEMVHARGWLVAHNTVYLLSPAPGLTWGIEARFADSEGTFAYNLTNMGIWHDRDGALGVSEGDVTTAQASWFADGAGGDLHLVSTATAAIDRASSLAEVTDDFDGDARPMGAAPDIGADEFGVPVPAAVIDLRITTASTAGGKLEARLRWTAPVDAATTILRYAGRPIDERSWSSATLVDGALPGETEAYTATVPYAGGTVYFALKSWNAGGASGLSNSAFWPSFGVYLPSVGRSN